MGGTRYATAHEAFEMKAADVEAGLDSLRLAITTKREIEAFDQSNWAHTGDLVHLAKLLNEALAFIGGK